MNKNTIYYKFLSEKKKYSINFDTTEISIGDIKREIGRRRNMEKAPEKYDLLFYDENDSEIRDESYKVEPLKLLIIKRIPSYKLSSQFVEVINDPSDIALMKGNEYNYAHKTQIAFVNNTEPLEKISSKLTLQQLEDKFKCSNCNKKEKDDEGYIYNPVITLCCQETICEQCANSNTEQCLLCNKPYVGHMPNKSEYELKEKLYEIYQKVKEASIQMQLNIQSHSSNINGRNDMMSAMGNNPNNISNHNMMMNGMGMNSNHSNHNNLYGNNSMSLPRPNITIMPKEHNPIANIQLNPSYPFFEKGRFFIIKSSNKENIEISQKHSEWATTCTNQKKLNEAFQSANVILIFSASRTSCFQGYGIMTTYIGDKVSNNWQNENNVKLGGSFGVIWLSCCEMPFNRVKHIVNPINNESVTKSRDTQELTKEIGFELCTMCYEQEKAESSLKPMKVINHDWINNEIKISRDKQLQRQNPGILRVPPMVNPSFYPFIMNPSYMYSLYPMMAQTHNQQQVQLQASTQILPNAITSINSTAEKQIRERSRDHSVKSKSSRSHSSSKKSKN